MIQHQEKHIKSSGYDSNPLTNKPYLKNEVVDTNYLEGNFKNRVAAPKIETVYHMEFYEGAELVRLKSTVIDPFTHHTHKTNPQGQLRGLKQQIKTFTHKSRLNLINQLAMVNKNRIPERQVWFLTLTLKGGRSVNDSSKRYLNNFLTQLRTKYDTQKWFYCWKLEYQERGVVHFHICFFGLKRMHHFWIRETWSRITLPKDEYKQVCSIDNKAEKFKKLVITDLARSRGWGDTQRYFSKVLGYVSKCDDRQKELIQQYNTRPVGRFWGIGNKAVYKSYIDRYVVKLKKREFNKVRRVFIKCLKSRWLRTHGDNFDWKMWKNYKRFLTSGRMVKWNKTYGVRIFNPSPEIRLFVNNDVLARMFVSMFPNKEPLLDKNNRSVGKEKWETSQFIMSPRVKVLRIAS